MRGGGQRGLSPRAQGLAATCSTGQVQGPREVSRRVKREGKKSGSWDPGLGEEETLVFSTVQGGHRVGWG